MTAPKKKPAAKKDKSDQERRNAGHPPLVKKTERRVGETERRREWHPPASNYFHTNGGPAPLVGPTIDATEITSADIVTGEPPRAPIQLCIDRINVALIGVEGTLDEVGDALQSILAVPPESKEDPKPGYQGTSEMTSRLIGYENRLNLIRVAMEGIRDRIEL